MSTSAAPPTDSAPRLRKEDIERVFPTTALQQALLQTAGQPEHDVGFLHVTCDIEGRLDPALVQAAWDYVSSRHEALRMSVHYSESQGKTLQIVHRKAPLTVERVDLSALTTEGQSEAVEAHRAADRATGLRLDTAPVSRLTLFKLGPEQHRLLWACHHALVDGWSSWLVLTEWKAAYRAFATGQAAALGSSPSLLPYYKFLAQADAEEERRFWAEQLEGFRHPTPLLDARRAGGAHQKVQEIFLSESTVKAIQRLARACEVAPSTVVSAAWAVILGQRAQAQDVVFGTVVSGRPAGVLNAESMVGMFTNTLPLRVRLDAQAPVRTLVASTHQSLQAVLGYQHSSYLDIQAHSEVPPHHRLFDSLVVFQNFQGSTFADTQVPRLVNYRSAIATTYPVTLSVDAASTAWRVWLTYDETRMTATLSSLWLAALQGVIGAMVEAPDSEVARLPSTLPALDRRERASERTFEDNTAPVTDIEKMLVSIWARGFGVKAVGIDDDFFALGGHSLLAIRLFAEIEKTLKCRVPSVVLTTSPTIRQLAVVIEGQLAGQSPEGMLIPLSKTGTKAPLILMPAMGGEALFWQNLRSFDDNRPVYTLGLTTAETPWSPTASIAEIAGYYANVVAREIPEDLEVNVAGYSYGGYLAYDLAGHLRRMGRRVGTIVIIDTGVHHLPDLAREKSLRQNLPHMAVNAGRWIAYEWAQRNPDKWKARLKRLVPGRIADVLNIKSDDLILGMYDRDEIADQHLARMQLELEAAESYHPEPQDGRLVLLRAKLQGLRSRRSWDFGWSQLIRGPVQVIEIPGNHENLIHPPFDAELAVQLQAAITRFE